MGTELHCKSYSPECFPTGNIGKDTNSLWPIHYEETTTDANCRSVYSPRYTNQYCGYDREGLKQTILRHEAVFRAQVHELHRLHRIQRDLMDGIKRKAWASQQSTVPSCIALNNILNLSPSAAYTRDTNFQRKALQDKCIQCGPIHAESSSVSGKEPGKNSKMVIDLQLSADAYIQENMGSGKEKAIPDEIFVEIGPSNFDAKPESHVGLMSSNQHSCGEHCRMDFKLHNDLESHSLDHPAKVACYDKPSDLSSSRYGNGKSQNFGSSSEFRDLHGNVLPAKMYTAKHLPVLSFNGNVGKEQAQTFFKDKYGYSESEVKAIFGKKISGLPKPKQFNFLRSVNFLPTPSLSYPKETGYSVEQMTGNKRNHLSRTCSPQHPISYASGHLSCQGLGSESGPSDVQNRSLISAHGACNPGKEWIFDCSRSGSVEGKASIPCDKLLAFHESCPDVNALPDASSKPMSSGSMIFNNVENLDNAKSNSQEAQKCIKGWNEIYQTSESEINSAQMLSSFSQGEAMKGALDSKMLSSLQWSRLRPDPFSRENAKLEVTHQDMKDESSGISGSQKIFGVPVGRKAYIGCAPIDATKNSFHMYNSSRKIRSSDLDGWKLDKPTSFNGLKCSALGPLRGTNLNLNLTCSERKLLDTSQPSLQNDVKTTPVIDLELPAECLVEDRNIVEVPTTADCQQEKEPSTDAAILSAAEIILSISSHSGSHLSKGYASHDTLHWLAGLVCSNECNVWSNESDGGYEGNDGFSKDYDGMDYFEAMTLKLSDARFDDHVYKPPDQMKCPAPVLLPKTRSCQTRKQKQQRDFQKDVLPSIVSLSRHEVSEDLQMIGGMMRSTGQPWQASIARTTTRRRGRNRRRRLPRGKSMAILAAEETPPKQDCHKGKGKNDETAALASSLMSWGRTRRCRRQRHPSGSVASLFNINA